MISETITVKDVTSSIEYFSLPSVVQIQCSNEQNWKQFQFDFNSKGTFAELQTGSWWQDAIILMKKNCTPGKKYINLLN